MVLYNQRCSAEVFSGLFVLFILLLGGGEEHDNRAKELNEKICNHFIICLFRTLFTSVLWSFPLHIWSACYRLNKRYSSPIHLICPETVKS